MGVTIQKYNLGVCITPTPKKYRIDFKRLVPFNRFILLVMHLHANNLFFELF